MPQVRHVLPEDLPQLLEILNREIEVGYAHFGTEPMSLDELSMEFDKKDDYPWMAAVVDTRVLGFARAGAWKSRGAYSRTCEIGVYVEHSSRGQGVAATIYASLLPELRARGFKTILGGIALPNPASVRLHESFGFQQVGTLPKVGWKHGEWRDVGYWALTFTD